MRDGFIRAAAVSPELRVADCAFNTQKIIEVIDAAASSGVSLLTLPELCITGYTCGDLDYAKGFAATLSDECGVRVFCAAYRLAPEERFPAALDDAVVSYQYLLSKGYPASQILLCGESAGGGLIYALLNGYDQQKTIDFAVAASCLKHSVEHDFNMCSVAEVESLAGGNASGRVQR